VEITWYPEVSIIDEIDKEEFTTAAGPSGTDVVSIEGTGEQPEPEQTSVGIGEEESRLSKVSIIDHIISTSVIIRSIPKYINMSVYHSKLPIFLLC